MEKTKYIVHSDVNENNIYKEFDNSVDAIKYAKDNIADETWVDMVTFPEGQEDNYDAAEVFTIWNYADENYLDQDFPESDIANIKDVDDADYAEFDKMYKEDISLEEAVDKLEENEDEVECKGCYELTPKKECIKTEAGYFCPHCAKELKEAKEDEGPFDLDFDDAEDEEESEEKPEEVKEEPKEEPKSYEELIDFLIADEDEAIKGYDKVLAQLDDKHVIEELNKVRTEEVAHKEFLEKIKEDKTAIYVEPLEPEESEEETEEETDLEESKKEGSSKKDLKEDIEKEIKDYLAYCEKEKLEAKDYNSLKKYLGEPVKENLTEGDELDDAHADDLFIAADKHEEEEKAMQELQAEEEAPKDECHEKEFAEDLNDKEYFDAMYKAYKELTKRKTTYAAVYGYSKEGKFVPVVAVKNNQKELTDFVNALRTKPKGQTDVTVYTIYKDRLDNIEDVLKEQGYIKEVKEEINKDVKVKIGDVIHINHLQGEDTSKDGKEGIVKAIDDIGQLHGTWGSVAVIPGVDDFEVIKPEITEDIKDENSVIEPTTKINPDDTDAYILNTIASW